MEYLVLETAGKHESVDYAKVHSFSTIREANEYIDKVCTGKQKYWVAAEIVQIGQQVALMQPEN